MAPVVAYEIVRPARRCALCTVGEEFAGFACTACRDASGTAPAVQTFLQGPDAIAQGVHDARAAAHVERPERPARVDPDQRRVRSRLPLDVEVAGGATVRSRSSSL